ncbi:polysaccharide deacetylase family protein [Novosphingobium lentum]|uniref:polysaccharide deacetylase family protein n=1 Tax=Novosphingobium lentum TaxID=145287 RepID=UPI00082A21AF|nr:polysaccharide deacetylase family protein [Novosphingobium lentum]
MSDRRLLLSIHDVGPRFESAVDQLRDRLSRHAPAGKLALLVVPNHWGEAPLLAGSAFATRLRGWADAGSDIFVHGFFHRDTARHRGLLSRLKASHMTAGEGEFLGLDREAAAARMADGRQLIEDITGRPAAGFIAPAWLYGKGALAALADNRFALAEDHWKVWQPGSGRVLARGPVLTWASRSPARIASSLLAARALGPVLHRSAVARIGVHPGDTGVPEILASIDRAVAALTPTHRAARYGDLVQAPVGGAA